MQFLNSRLPSTAHECHHYKVLHHDCYELVVVHSLVQLPSMKWTHVPSSPREQIQKQASRESSKIPRSLMIHFLHVTINAKTDIHKNLIVFLIDALYRFKENI